MSLDDGGESVVSDFVRQMGMNYPVLMGNMQVGEQYGGVQALPTTFYIGRDGSVLTVVPGLVSHHDVEQNIRRALAQPASPSAASANSVGQ